MDKKKFELVATIIFLLSLLCVPTKVCVDENYCVGVGWYLFWDLSGLTNHNVDISLFVIQSVVVAGILFAIWRFKFKD